MLSDYLDRVSGDPNVRKNTMVAAMRHDLALALAPKTFIEKLKDGEYGSKNMDSFRDDMLVHYGVTDNPKAEAAWRLAYAHRHSSDCNEIHCYFQDCVELIK